MAKVSVDNLPHLFFYLLRRLKGSSCLAFMKLYAKWWSVSLGQNCSFHGFARFYRHPSSTIDIGEGCRFNSSPTSNFIGINRPCIVSTLRPNARLEIGNGCGFSGTVIGCAKRIVLEDNVRCGANTLITDTDWHWSDPRSGPDSPVTLGKNVWLGTNVTVLKGVTIGANSVIGANSTVTRSIPPNVVAAGSPAKVIHPIDISAGS